MIYLYVKTHNKTGLKYLGKTKSKNPYRYRGSGTYWSNHIKKHGYDCQTEILLATENEEELRETGLFFSKIFNVVESSDWANLKEESGDGGWIINLEHLKSISTKGGFARAKLVKEGKISVWNKDKSITRSIESIEKQRNTITGKKRGNYQNYNHQVSSKSVTIYGVRYNSIAEAKKATGHSYYTILRKADSIEN
jgi:hypothetical protein